MSRISIIGGGLAGSEAAWQAASAGVRVVLHEMRPVRPTAVHKSDRLAELVCSNSFRGDKLDNAVGVLKEEMRRLGSLIMRAADDARVPAGAALAVDRERFSGAITEAVTAHPLIEVVRGEVPRIPEPSGDPVIIASGPLTSDSLSADIAALVGAKHLYFYDAISPIVLAETIDRSKVFRASRWGRSLRRQGDALARRSPGIDSAGEGGCGVDDGEGDYLNCPFTREEYERFYDALVSAEKSPLHDFDDPRFFEGCLPIEVMAARGVDTLRFGPMKPVGLRGPDGRRPWAVVQLRAETLEKRHFNLVGFQSRMKWPDQQRVFRTLPGFAAAEFVRLGQIHRNTFINAPRTLDVHYRVRSAQRVRLAGQLTGVEGYLESAATGLAVALDLALGRRGGGEVEPAPPETALGALARHLTASDPEHFQPANVHYGLFPPLDPEPPKRERRAAYAARARAALDAWRARCGL